MVVWLGWEVVVGVAAGATGVVAVELVTGTVVEVIELSSWPLFRISTTLAPRLMLKDAIMIKRGNFMFVSMVVCI